MHPHRLAVVAVSDQAADLRLAAVETEEVDSEPWAIFDRRRCRLEVAPADPVEDNCLKGNQSLLKITTEEQPAAQLKRLGKSQVSKISVLNLVYAPPDPIWYHLDVILNDSFGQFFIF